MSSTGDPPGADDSARVAAAMAAQAWPESGHLSLRRLGLRVLPDALQSAPNLRSLDISGNRLAELPAWLWELAHLEQLAAAANRLRRLDRAVSRLSRLRELDVSDNRLSELPPELAGCQELRRLDVSGNALQDISVLGQMPALVVLDAADNRIGALTLPPSPATLQSLDLSGNRLESLPDTFAAFRVLRRLDLSGNRLTSADLAVIRQLPLQELYLDDNLLGQRLDLGEVRNLQRLSMLGNPAGEEAASAEPGQGTISEQVAGAVAGYVSSTADPERQYFDSPTYDVGVSLSVDGPRDAQRVVDMYYKRYPGVPANMAFSDGSTIDLQSLSRSTALEFVGEHQTIGTDSRISLPPTRDSSAVSRGTTFFAEAVARVDRAGLVQASGDAPAVEFSQAPLSPLARVLNIALTDAEHRVLVPTASLEPLLEYAIRIDIGPEVEESIVINPVPIREEDLHASSTNGFWFDVVVASTDVEVAADVRRLFLPFDGPSWVCSCPGPDHTCTPQDRQAYLFVPIRTRADHGAATLRCTIYNNNNAVQSVRADFTVAPAGEPGLIQGVLDFALARDVADTGELKPRQLNVLMNESASGTHKIVVNNGERAIAVDVTESSARGALTAIRGKLQEITLGSDGKVSQYDQENGKRTSAFVHDLKQLALLGSQLWAQVVPDRDDRAYLRGQLVTRATIQITRVTPTAFPWALLYDIPREVFEEWILCPLLGNWEANRAQLGEYPEACPHQAAHRGNVLCPFGFWGFRHLLEQPPSVRHGALRTQIRVAEPAHAAAARSLALNPALTSAHFKDLEECFSGRFALDACDSRAAIRAAFADATLPLVYFYCHGRRAELAGTQLTVPFLEIGTDDRIGPSDFAEWDEGDAWGPAHWADVAPLIFINGCETAKLSPEDVITFVDALAGMDAAGVVGTEIPVTQQVAGEVALRFYRQFVGAPSAPVGTALYRTRIDLLRKGNVAGLAYTPFCSMDLSLNRSGSNDLSREGGT